MTKLRRSVYKSILFHHKRWRVPRVTSRHPHCVLNECGMHGLSGLDLGNNYLICTTMVITMTKFLAFRQTLVLNEICATFRQIFEVAIVWIHP